jgi:hypothetical protein
MIEKKKKVFYGFESDSFKTVMKASIENKILDKLYSHSNSHKISN